MSGHNKQSGKGKNGPKSTRKKNNYKRNVSDRLSRAEKKQTVLDKAAIGLSTSVERRHRRVINKARVNRIKVAKLERLHAGARS